MDHIYLVKADSNGVASGTVSVVVTGTNSLSQSNSDFKIFPNPANDHMFVSIDNNALTNNDSFEILITDMLGREQYKKQFNNFNPSGPIEINLAELNAGLYTITVENGKTSVRQKLVVQR